MSLGGVSKATQITLKQRGLDEFWGNVEEGAAAAKKSADALAPNTCERLGTFKNPIKLYGDRVAVIVKWMITLVQTFGAGKIDPGIDNPNAPDPLSDAIYKSSIKDNVKSGEWFYFSSQPEWVFESAGDYISTVYNTKTGAFYSYDRYGNERPSAQRYDRETCVRLQHLAL